MAFEKPNNPAEGNPERLRIRQERQKAMLQGKLKEWEAANPEEAARMKEQRLNPLEGKPEELQRRREQLAKLYPPKAAENIVGKEQNQS